MMGLPAGERRGHLPAGDHQREVPRHDQGAGAHRLAEHHVEAVVLHGHHRAVVLVGGAGVELERGGGRAHLPAGVADGVAGAAGLGHGELLGALTEQVGDPRQHPAAVGRRHAGPGPVVERPGRGPQRGVDVGHARLGDRARRGGRGGVDGVERGALDGIASLTGDEEKFGHDDLRTGWAGWRLADGGPGRCGAPWHTGASGRGIIRPTFWCPGRSRPGVPASLRPLDSRGEPDGTLGRQGRADHRCSQWHGPGGRRALRAGGRHRRRRRCARRLRHRHRGAGEDGRRHLDPGRCR